MTTAAPLRLILDPVGDELEAARACEADVFLQAYGNTAEEFVAEYGPYDDNTGYLTVLREDGLAVAACRFIAEGAAGLKTLNDVGREPWMVDGLRSARAAGVDPARTWDIATIAVRKGMGRGGLCAAALYHGIVNGAVANGVEYLIAIMDTHARGLLHALGMQTYTLPGTKAGEYLGSEASTPVWGNLQRTFDMQQADNPDAYRLVRHGIGLDGIALPTDWVSPRWNVAAR